MTMSRKLILGAWLGYGLLWAGAVTSTRWAPSDAGILVILGFGVGLVVASAALGAGVVLGALALWRAPRLRRTGNVLVLTASALGLALQLWYAWLFWRG
jgi:hypothetical protein